MKTEIEDLVGREVTVAINYRGRDLATVRGVLKKRAFDDGYAVRDGDSFAWPEANSQVLRSGSKWRVIYRVE